MSTGKTDLLARISEDGFFFAKASDIPTGFRRLYYFAVTPKGIVAAPPEMTETIARRVIDFLSTGGLFYGVEVLTSDPSSSSPSTKACFDLDYQSTPNESNDGMVHRNLSDATHLLSVIFATCKLHPNTNVTCANGPDGPETTPGHGPGPGPIFLLCKAKAGVHLISPNVCMTTADMKRVTEKAMCSTSSYRPTLDLPMPYDTQIYGTRGGSLRGLGAYKRVGGEDYYKPMFRWSLLTGTWARVHFHRGRISKADYMYASLLISPEASGLVSIPMAYHEETDRQVQATVSRAAKRVRTSPMAMSTTVANGRTVSDAKARSLSEPMLLRKLPFNIWSELKDTLMTYGHEVGRRYGELGYGDFELKARTSELHSSSALYLCPSNRARKLCPLLATMRSNPEHKSNGGYFVLDNRHGHKLAVTYTLTHVCHDDMCRKLRKQNPSSTNTSVREVSPAFYEACLAAFLTPSH